MKKILILLIALSLLFTICGCGECEHKDWNKATCTEPKTCVKCGITEGDPLGHDWREATFKAPKTCRRCEQTEGEPIKAEYFNICFSDYVSQFNDAYNGKLKIAYDSNSSNSNSYYLDLGGCNIDITAYDQSSSNQQEDFNALKFQYNSPSKFNTDDYSVMCALCVKSANILGSPITDTEFAQGMIIDTSDPEVTKATYESDGLYYTVLAQSGSWTPKLPYTVYVAQVSLYPY